MNTSPKPTPKSNSKRSAFSKVTAAIRSAKSKNNSAEKLKRKVAAVKERIKVLDIPDEQGRQRYLNLLKQHKRSDDESSSDESSSESSDDGNKSTSNKSHPTTAPTSSSNESSEEDSSDSELIKAIISKTACTPSKRPHNQLSKSSSSSLSEDENESESDLSPKMKRYPYKVRAGKVKAGPGILESNPKTRRRRPNKAMQSNGSGSSEDGSIYEDEPKSDKKEEKPPNTIMNYFSSPDKVKKQKQSKQNNAPIPSPRRTRSKVPRTK